MVAPRALELRLNAIDRLPEVRWLVADILEIRQPNELTHENHFGPLQKVCKQVTDDVYRLERPTGEMLTWPILPVLGAMMIRRDLFTETGLFDETLTYGEDVHFCLLLTRYADLYWIPKACLFLRRYHNSMTKDLFRGACEIPEASLSLLKDHQFRPFKKQLRWLHAANLRLLSGGYLRHGKRIKSFISAVSALY